MARLPRFYIEGCPQHIIQRGNNRDVCFYNNADYAFYLKKLLEASEKFRVSVHAYVLMTNHVHLLVTPSDETGVSKMMQTLGRNYVCYINFTYSRTGTLWEGRFKSSIVESDSYFLRVCRYIELNPVRAKMVVHPGEYPWSSYRSNGMGVEIKLVTPHLKYIELGFTKSGRLLAYRQWVESALDLEDIDEIRICSNKEWVIGSRHFREQIQNANDRRVARARPGGDRRSEAKVNTCLV